MLRSICILATVFITKQLMIVSSINAAEYKVEWTSPRRTYDLGDIPIAAVSRPVPWHTYNHANGALIRNLTNISIKCIRIKATAINTTFLAAPPSSDAAFPTIWKRKNNLEIVFMDGNISPGEHVWNSVKDPRAAPGSTGEIFEGQVYERNFQIDDPENWERVPPAVSTGFSVRPNKWDKLLSSLPRQYQSISCYYEPEHGRDIYFISGGFPFAYNFNSEKMRPIILSKMISGPINRITVTDRNIELWSNGNRIESINMDDEKRFANALKKNGV